MRVKLWGTRGLIPAPSPANIHYGGSTSCVEVETGDGQRFILDGGIGLCRLGGFLNQNGFGSGAGQAHILLTHTHWSHIQGIPFFRPLLVAGNRFTLHGCGGESPLLSLLNQQMHATYCPVPNFFQEEIGADMRVQEIGPGPRRIGRTTIHIHRVNHVPDQVCFGFRLESEGASLAYIPDIEYLVPAHRRPALELAQGVDLLIHDAHYTADEYPRHRGQGHACDGDAASIARQAGASRLLLFHHHPDRSDARIDAIVAAYRDSGIAVDGAREDAEYCLGGRNG